MAWILSILTLGGFTFTFWLFIGILRLVYEYIFPPKYLYKNSTIDVNDIAVIIPAHNEELTIGKTLKALLEKFPSRNIYVASDFSSDKTVEIARAMHVRSLDIRPNKGKAKSLVHMMHEYRLLKDYKYIIINDADTVMHKDYLECAARYFHDPDVVAVANHGVSRWRKYKFWEAFFISYRTRLWTILQLGMRYGQTWKYTNMSFIVPGSLSFYRTSALAKLEIDAPGLLIEDFNMTFELHKKNLGKIAYSPNIMGIHQDPYNLRDYARQVERWNIGFFQTVKRHGFWPSFFWLATTYYYVEFYLYAIFFALLPTIFLALVINGFEPLPIPFTPLELRWIDLVIGIFVIDYVTTIAAAIIAKKPVILFYGLGFFFLRYLDALIAIGSPVVAFTAKSTGTWKSPERK